MACFTNHALDSFIESLMDAGVDSGIVRVGGRSKSERVQRFNLRALAPSAGEGPGVLGARCQCWCWACLSHSPALQALTLLVPACRWARGGPGAD